MYKILIVDDEPLERSAIKYLINQNNFELDVRETNNGKNALEILAEEHIHILLTDIKMPIMDGITLAEKATQLYPDIHILFFSGYNDFSYLKKALSVHAINYLLKPIDPEEFSSTMQQILFSIQQQETQNMQNKARLLLLQNLILYKLLNKVSVKELSTLYPQLDFSFAYNCHRLFLIQMNQEYFGELSGEDEAVITPTALHNLLPPDCHLINLNPTQNVLFFLGPDHLISWYESLAKRLSGHIRDCTQIDNHIVISDYISSPDDIADAYEEAERHLLDILSPSLPSEDSSSAALLSETSPIDPAAILNQLRLDIQFKDSVGLLIHLKQLFYALRSNGNCSQIYFRFQCTAALNILLDGFTDKTATEFDKYASVISHSIHMSSIESLLVNLGEELATVFDKAKDTPKQNLQRVKLYINTHYSEDLSLEILSKKVFLSPKYLSTLFTEFNGYGINKYIKKIRMEKAQELLINTQLPIKMIAQQVGYSSTSYFCRSFTKEFDIFPDKFRNQKHLPSERGTN